MPPVSSAVARRPPRVTIDRAGPAVARARLTWLNAAATKDRGVPRPTAARVGIRPSMRNRAKRNRLPLEIELVRATALISLAVLAVTVVLPVLLGLAAASFR